MTPDFPVRSSWEAQEARHHGHESGSRGLGATGFDYCEVDRRLAESGQTKVSGEVLTIEDVWHALLTILIDVVLPMETGSCKPDKIGVRTIAFLAYARPEEFDGAAIRKVAARAGVSPEAINAHFQRLRARFGVRRTLELPPAQIQKLKAGQIRRWAERKAAVEHHAEQYLRDAEKLEAKSQQS